MKAFVALAISISPHVCSAALIKKSKTRDEVGFGPQNCVSLTRSADGGSCVISTDCEGADLSTTEFSFDCIRQGGEIVRHSFGTGGFDPSEEFDTQVKCKSCETTSPADVVMKEAIQAPVKTAQLKKAKEEVHQTVPAPVVFTVRARNSNKAASQGASAGTAQVSAQADAKASFWPFSGSSATASSSEPEVVKYGPNGCVSTWRSSEGHCIIRTNCAKGGESFSKYEFGLVCVDKVGSPVRHLFGRDSFDAEETFDTLIKCDKCLGLEDIPDAVALNGEVVTLSKDISNLKDVMKNISINVQMLNAEVFKSAPAAAAPAPAAALLHHSTAYHRTNVDNVAEVDQTVQKLNLRHSHKKHRHEDDGAEDEDDDRESEGDEVQAAVLPDDEYDADDED